MINKPILKILFFWLLVSSSTVAEELVTANIAKTIPQQDYQPLLIQNDFPELLKIKTILNLTENEIDLARAKLTIDKMIDPSIDIEATLKRIDSMVTDVQNMISTALPPERINSIAKMLALRTYLYDKGAWNRQQTFSYNLSDPFGKLTGSMLLPRYLETRKGNCVSMPILHMIMGDKLGLNMVASTAPQHIFIKFTDDDGNTLNLESTSGGKPSRDVWIKQQFSITEQAIENGIYLQTLTKKETITVNG